MQWRPDIIHSQCEFSTFRIAKHISKILHIPIVHTYHTIYEDYTHYFSPNHKWGKAMVALFTKKILKHTTSVIAPTEKVSSLLKNYGVEQTIHVVPTGIYLKQFTAQLTNKQRKAIHDEFEIPYDHRILLFDGRLAKEKYIEELLSYIAQLKEQKLTFLIVGDGPHRDYLQGYAKDLSLEKTVVFTGLIEPNDIAFYYQFADLFVSASNSETQGLTYIEALASGIPAICREDSCLEKVIKNGVNGWQYHDYADFREAVQALLTDPILYQRMVKNAKEGAFRDYSSKSFAVTMEGIYTITIASHYVTTEHVC